MKVLVTGGAGYIGSHTVIELVKANHNVVVIDNLSNSTEESLRRVTKITGKPVDFHKLDIRDEDSLNTLFANEHFEAVIHFAGLKAVGESVKKPIKYYENNVGGSVCLIGVMARYNVRKLIFSSSATVYGNAPFPYVETETTGIGITNPYGQTKYMIEQVMRDAAIADNKNIFVALRYFNPVGAHPSGLIGEDPNDIPNNLMPFIAQVAVGRLEELRIFGNDYSTVDGTGVRDYIHVVDLAKGHVAALNSGVPGFDAINLGSGRGTSVIQLVNAFENASGRKIRHRFTDRRPGDLPEYYANSDKASLVLGWRTERNIEDMCLDTWRWQSKNPNGFRNT